MTTRILFIEDDPDIKALYDVAFSQSGYKIDIVEDVEQGLKITKQKSPVLVLLDLILPHKEGESPVFDEYLGFSYLEAKSLDESLKDIPVVVFSNLKEKKLENRARELGAIDYVVKSQIEPLKMIEFIQKYIN